MDKEKLKADISSAIEEYASTPEAWEDAVLVVDSSTGAVELMEAEESASLPEDKVDVWDPMDFIEMTPDGAWRPDNESINMAVAEY